MAKWHRVKGKNQKRKRHSFLVTVPGYCAKKTGWTNRTAVETYAVKEKKTDREGKEGEGER